MGGFVFVNGDHERVLDFYDFRGQLGLFGRAPQIPFPTIEAKEICDKARGDFLSKAIVILQSLWFIVQCIARGKQGFALTELELVTLALASLTGVLYFFWWDKPLGVKEPIKIYRQDQEPPKRVIEGGLSEHERREQRIENSYCSLVQTLIIFPLHQLQLPLVQLLKDFRSILFLYYGRLSSISSSSSDQFLKDQQNKLHERIPAVRHLWFLYLPVYWLIWIPFNSFVNALSAIVDTYSVESDKSRVATFYAPWLSSSIKTSNLFLFGVAPIAVIFGALHCIAWNFHFPSHIEQLLWRVGSLAISLIPFVPTLLVLVIRAPIKLVEFLGERYQLSLPSASLSRSVEDMLAVILGFLASAGLTAYMLARLLLLTQAIVLLRSQPGGAFYAIEWVSILPHI